MIHIYIFIFLNTFVRIVGTGRIVVNGIIHDQCDRGMAERAKLIKKKLNSKCKYIIL